MKPTKEMFDNTMGGVYKVFKKLETDDEWCKKKSRVSNAGRCPDCEAHLQAHNVRGKRRERWAYE